MQTNFNVNHSNPAFGISVSESFIKGAHNYFNGVEYRPWRAEIFDKKVAKMFNDFGYDEFTINYKKVNKDGKTFHALSADREDLSVPLTENDHFRKVIEKFQRMTKGELYIKIKQFRHDNPKD